SPHRLGFGLGFGLGLVLRLVDAPSRAVYVIEDRGLADLGFTVWPNGEVAGIHCSASPTVRARSACSSRDIGRVQPFESAISCSLVTAMAAPPKRLPCSAQPGSKAGYWRADWIGERARPGAPL